MAVSQIGSELISRGVLNLDGLIWDPLIVGNSMKLPPKSQAVSRADGYKGPSSMFDSEVLLLPSLSGWSTKIMQLSSFISIVTVIGTSTVAWAQQTAYGQCGGVNWTGNEYVTQTPMTLTNSVSTVSTRFCAVNDVLN
ncbi:hypothetical protein FRC17_000457 [Serendipita sp. 399]|nr:hypothetical protein FRC17_000457 [Serendipita sp. 399]